MCTRNRKLCEFLFENGQALEYGKMQAGILAVGGTQHVVRLQEPGKLVSEAKMNLVLSADQRVFDGETASKFLKALCNYLANPVKLVI